MSEELYKISKAEWDRLERWKKSALVEKRAMCGIYRDDLPDYTTDRNACALVVDEISKQKRWHSFSSNMQKQLGIVDDGPPLWSVIWIALRADPDLICYCAVEASDVPEV